MAALRDDARVVESAVARREGAAVGTSGRKVPRCVWLLFVTVSLLSHSAAAQSNQPAVRADAAFLAGKKLLAEGATAAACEQFARSYEALPRHGTLLNLAVCREQEGLLATAFRLFQQAHAFAVADQRTDRERLAQEHLDGLGPRLTWLRVQAKDGSPVPNAEVLCDGIELSAEPGGMFAVDTGKHRIRASALGFEQYETELDVTLEPHSPPVVTLRRAALASPAGPNAGSPWQTTPVTVDRRVAAPVTSHAQNQPTNWKTPTGFVLVGVGLVGIVTGTIFGIKAIVDSREARDVCTDLRCTSDAAWAEGSARTRSARQAALVANIALPVGAVAAGSGALLLHLSPRATNPTGAAALHASWTGTW